MVLLKSTFLSIQPLGAILDYQRRKQMNSFKNGEHKYLQVTKETVCIEQVMRTKGIPCPYVGIEGDEVTRLSSWLLIDNDLYKAREAFSLLLKLENRIPGDKNIFFDDGNIQSVVTTNLFISAIVTYGKCFNEARGRTVRLSANEVLGHGSKNFLTHKLMIELRNKYVAHGDKSKHEEVVVRVALNPDLNEKRVQTVYNLTLCTAGLALEQIADFINTIDVFKKYIETKISECYKDINDGLKDIPIETLYAEATFLDENYNSIDSK